MVFFALEAIRSNSYQAENQAKNAAIDRFLQSPLIQDFFAREKIESEEIRRHLVDQCINQIVQKASIETSAQRIGVLNSLKDEQRMLALLNHSGFTHAYLRKLNTGTDS